MDEKALIDRITKEIVEKINSQQAEKTAAPAAGVSMPAPGAGSGSFDILPMDMAKYIDHTLLKPEATAEQIDKLCDEAREYKFCSVCVNTGRVAQCAKNLRGSGVKVCCVVGFPLGAMSSKAKNLETRHAIEDGANEIDMVINIGALKDRNLKLVEEDIKAVKRACGQRALLKVIIETALLTTEEIVLVSEIVKRSGADYIKTSTGFSTHGAKPEHVALMRRVVGPDIGVKAAGGVRTFEDAVEMIKAGATRLGTSGGVKIVKGETIESGY